MGVPANHVTQLELLILTTWLMKDLGWVLLLAPLAWLAAVGAICMEFHSTLTGWKVDSAAVRAHGVATLLWIFGNSIWMTSELLFDASSSYNKQTQHSIFPWHDGPLAGSNKELYTTGLHVARGLFGLAFALLLSFYAYSAWQMRYATTPASSRNPQDEAEDATEVEQTQDLVWGIMTPQVYMMVFIGPWILKDFFWTFELLAPALACSVVVFLIVADGYRRFSSIANLAEISWIIGNAVWVITELGLAAPALAPRLCAASFLFAGAVISMVAFVQAHFRKGSSDASEETPLIAGQAAN
jgi:hypothetical protein